MLKDLQYYIVLILGITFISCQNENEHLEILPMVINLRGINTQYDDFNSAGPSTFGYSGSFIYSTNAGTAGDNFDIWRATISLFTDDEFASDETNYDIDCRKDAPFMHKQCNSNYNEYGPYIWTENNNHYENFLDESQIDDAIYIFTSDRPTDSTTDKLNLYYLSNNDTVKELPINSNSNDAYGCYIPINKSLLFCSDRGGQYDIYHSSLNCSTSLSNSITDSIYTPPEKNTILSSEFDDKCPYLNNNILVFVSNRHGDHSNYDIYFSKFANGIWTDPKRCPEIMIDEDVEVETNDNDKRTLNSTYDEFRPILVKGWGNNSDEPYIMIFSSNRPNGKGGFDLHLAVLPDNIFD